MKAPSGPNPNLEPRLRDALRLAQSLEKWDAPASVPVLQAVHRRNVALLADPKTYVSCGESAELAARAILTRMSAGDPTALTDYARWVRTIRPREAVGFEAGTIFEPMWRNPTNVAIQQAANALFTGRASVWTHPETDKTNWTLNGIWELVRMPMVGVAGFRDLLLRLLENQAPDGTIQVLSEKSVTARTNGSQQDLPPGFEDPLAKPGPETPFRVCDYWAHQISEIPGAPLCEPYWPLDLRNRAEAAQIRFLGQYGDRFQYVPLPYEDTTFRAPPPRPVFPSLDHPATQEDVRQGRAIFSLGKTGARVVKLAHYPLRARWTTLKKYPVEQEEYAPDEGMRTKLTYLQEGEIWQAEEIVEGGKLHRYYGFIGSHEVAKVPASEIEILGAP